MKDLILIGLGGGIGAICRFLLSRTVNNLFSYTFPFGTFLVNVLGCFFIGLFSVFILERVIALNEELRALLLIGLLGGFTTFSTFSLEALKLLENGEGIKMTLYILLSVGLGIIAAWGGLIIGRKI